jgi:hypothetical protein
MAYAEAMEFNINGSTVTGFTTRAPFATGGTAYDASAIVTTGTLEFDLKMTALPIAGATDWKLKVESAGDPSQKVEVSLMTSLEGHAAPVLDQWQHYSFTLSGLDTQTLDLSAIDVVLVFPEFGTGDGATFRLDNVNILTNVVQNPGATDNTANDTGTAANGNVRGGAGGGSPGPVLFLLLGGLLMVRRARQQPRSQ